MRDHGLRSYDELVAHYLSEQKAKADNELRWFRMQRKVHDAVRLAGLASGPYGKRFVHQYRIPRRTLQRASRELLRNLRRLGRCRSFDELLVVVEETIGPINGIGPLMVYDTSLRIGARLGLPPRRIYLHAGTRHGAEALGLGSGAASIGLDQLPGRLSSLTAEQAEDILCLYSADLLRIARTRGRESVPAR